MKFKILHTNDVHSNYENFAKIKTLIDMEKDENTIILDAGDFGDFKRIELLGTKGKLAGNLLKYAGYDAITVGNNETFQGVEMLETMAHFSPVPFLSCNLLKDGKAIKGVKPFIIRRIKDVRFLVIGTSPILPIFNELLGFSDIDYNEEIKKIIKENDHDVCILLNHISTIKDEIIANAIPGIDIIISGHDHQLFNEARLISNVINHSAGSYGEYLGVIEFSYENKQVTLTNSYVRSTKDISPDHGILEIINEHRIEAIDNLSKPLFFINKTLYHDLIEECPIANLIADGLKDFLNCDIGLINSGILNGGIPEGEVTELKLIEIAPSPLNATSFEIKGRDLKEALNLSLNSAICLLDGKGPGFRGIALGRLHVSGMEIHYHHNTITKILIDNKPFDEDKYYKVASSDYLQRNNIYATLANNKNPIYKVEYIRDILRIYLNKKGFVEESFKKRWIKERSN